MSSYIPPKENLAFNEIITICPHCKVRLIKQIEIMATGEPKHAVVTRVRCPECFNFL